MYYFIKLPIAVILLDPGAARLFHRSIGRGGMASAPWLLRATAVAALFVVRPGRIG